MTTSRLFRSLVASLALVSALSFTGCAVVAVGAIVGAVAYLEGELKAELRGNIHEAVDATKAAARDLDLKPYSQTGDASRATMMATRPDGQRVIVRLEPRGPHLTVVRIRVGQFGERDYSYRVLRQIERYL